MWGAYWNWDPRQSSYLLLIFLYGAYLFLRAAVEDPEKKARLAAAYALFAIVPMLFLVFVAPRITRSLHPQTVINAEGRSRWRAHEGRLLRRADRVLLAVSLDAVAGGSDGSP